MRKVVFLALLMVSLSVPSVALPVEFRNIIAFGDSLTDNGFADGYGFKLASNGRVWVEYLAPMVDCTTLEDRAWAGGRTDRGSFMGTDWSGFNWQVDTYSPSMALSDTLFTVWIGINDFYDGKGDAISSVKNIEEGINKLIKKGAKNILVLNTLDFTMAPAFQKGHEYEPAGPKVKKIITEFNQKLDEALFDKNQGLVGKNGDVNFYFLDIYSLFNEMKQTGIFKNTSEAWYGTYKYPDPTEYMWWDEWHPMTEVHRRIADKAFSVLAEGPVKTQ